MTLASGSELKAQGLAGLQHCLVIPSLSNLKCDVQRGLWARGMTSCCLKPEPSIRDIELRNLAHASPAVSEREQGDSSTAENQLLETLVM